MSSSKSCSSCNKSDTSHQCGLCEDSICKNCAQFLSDDQFSFYAQAPTTVAHSVYCPNCYAMSVAPEIEKYDQIMTLASEVSVFDKKQGKETRFVRRIEKPVSIIECNDRDEALMRLAFKAAQIGCNSLVDVDLKSKKVKVGTYHKNVWDGSGVPAKIERKQLVRDRSTWSNPN